MPPAARGIADPAHRTDFSACRGAGGRPRGGGRLRATWRHSSSRWPMPWCGTPCAGMVSPSSPTTRPSCLPLRPFVLQCRSLPNASESPVSRHSGSHELPSVLAQIAIQSDMSVQGDGLDRQRSHTASGRRSRMHARTWAPGRRAPCSTAECGRAKARRDRRMLDDTRTRLPCGASGCGVVSADTFLLYMILIYREKPSHEA